MSRSRVRRAFGAGLAAVVFAGVVGWQVTPAYAAPFSMSLVGGSFGLGSQGATSLGGGSTQCQNGTDDEFLAPFGTPDALIDYPADPDCVNPYDNDETLSGFQAPDPVEFTGTIDDSSNFTVSSSFTPIPFVTTSPAATAGACDGDLLVVKITAGFSDLAPHTGNLVTGDLTLNLRLDTTLDIQCDTDLGPGQTFVPYDYDGAGGMDPWGGATPVSCAHDVSSLNTSASGDSAPASLTKTQAAGVTTPMSGKVLKPALLFGDVFDALPIAVADTRCGFFQSFVFGTASADNSTFQLAFMVGGSDYADLPDIDVNVGDVTVPEGDGGLGAKGCTSLAGPINCTNTATVVVTLSSPALVDSKISVIADNTTGGSATGTPKGTEILAPGPADYKQIPAARPRVLLIRAGKRIAQFAIPIAPDQTDESTETIFVQVVAVTSGLVINDGVGVVTIADDDGGVEPDPGISIGDAAVYETGSAAACGGFPGCKGTAVLPIVSQSPVPSDTTLSYTVTNGTDVVGVFDAAEAVNGKTIGDDFVPVNVAKFKIIRVNKTLSSIVVAIFGDNTSEPGVFSAETLTVRISGSGVTDGIGNIRILNDDT
jgi:hypothetical protein